jgi:outer membrane protein insertion porin family
MPKQSKPYLFMHFNASVLKSCLLLALSLTGCTATRFLQEDESFYTGASITIQADKKIEGEKKLVNTLNPYIQPTPNKTILGSRPGVWFYYAAGTPKKEKGFRNFVRKKLGTPPVLLSDASPQKTSTILETETNNNGYFGSTVSHETKTKHKKSKVIYTITLEPPFHLRNIDYSRIDSTNLTFYHGVVDRSLLKENERYQLERLQKDQQRVEEVAKNNGYYYFDDRYLLFDADSSVGKRMVDVALHYERPTPPHITRIYKIRNVNVFPNYSLVTDTSGLAYDTLIVDGFNYIDNTKTFKPKIITDVINILPDSIYRRINHEYTLSRLMSLKTFKYVNVKFVENHQDSTSLDANIYMTPLLKNSIRMQVEGVSKSNNFVGPGVELTLTNRNFLRGAEMLQFKMNGAYEWQISRQQAGALNSIEFGTSVGLYLPRFVAPFRIRNRSTKYLPQTQVKLAYNFQNRVNYFQLTSFNVNYGYNWRETTYKMHELFPVDVSFVKSSKTSAAFDSLLAQNTTLANSFQNQFIVGSRYSFTLNTQLREDIVTKYEVKDNRKSDFYFNGTIDFSGNVLNSIQRVRRPDIETHELFGSPYSQFVILSTDFRYYYRLSSKSKLAARLFAASGFAYSNSDNLPYIKQFASGGSNSIRAFPARSVGPGTYNVRTDPNITTNTYFIDQRGDIKLEGNIEYRFDIFKSLKGALFADAGNIWLRKEDVSRPGSKFTNQFLSQIAVGTGIGIRYDFNFFILRFDTSFPVRKPYLDTSNKWVFNQIDMSSKEWRKQNLVFNIAIGYPF